MLKFEAYTYRLYFWVALALYRLVLDFSYIYVLVPNFGYMGFDENITLFSYVISWALFLLMLPFVPEVIKRLSDFYRIVFFASLIVPLISFYGVNDLSFYPLAISCFSFLSFSLFTTQPFLKILPSLPVLSEGRFSVLVVSVILVIFLIVWYQYSGAVRFLNLDITKVYEFRRESASLANVGVLAYLNSWIYQVVTIFLFAFFIMRRSFILALMIVAVQVFFFAVSGHKSLLFYPVLVVGVWFYFSKTQGGAIIAFSLMLVVCFSVLLYFVFDNIWPASLFVRRVLFVPADLTYDYFEFFSKSSYVYWSNSVLSGYLSYPYDQGIAKLIGEFNNSGAAANNGFISSGFAHAGIFGVVFYTMLFSGFVLMLERYSSELPLWFSIAITIVPLRSAIVSSDLFTVLLTHGLLLTLIMIICFRSNRRQYI